MCFYFLKIFSSVLPFTFRIISLILFFKYYLESRFAYNFYPTTFVSPCYSGSKSIGNFHLKSCVRRDNCDSSKRSSLVAHWLSVPEEHGWYPDIREKLLLFHFWIVISWLPLTLELIHDYAKLSIHEIIHHVWLSVRLNNLIARSEKNWTKKSPWWISAQKSS